jgi:hypothetical protein
MSYEDREEVHQMDVDLGFTVDGFPDTYPPLGDEAFGLSHGGRDYEIFEGFSQDLSKLAGVFVLFH